MDIRLSLSRASRLPRRQEGALSARGPAEAQLLAQTVAWSQPPAGAQLLSGDMTRAPQLVDAMALATRCDRWPCQINAWWRTCQHDPEVELGNHGGQGGRT